MRGYRGASYRYNNRFLCCVEEGFGSYANGRKLYLNGKAPSAGENGYRGRQVGGLKLKGALERRGGSIYRLGEEFRRGGAE